MGADQLAALGPARPGDAGARVHAGPIDTGGAGGGRAAGPGRARGGRDEVLAEELTRTVKARVSDEAAVYLDFDPAAA